MKQAIVARQGRRSRLINRVIEVTADPACNPPL
jgi:hypothetical protein